MNYRRATMNRTKYHHGDLANALTVAATQLARDGGPEAVVLREAARKVGVSATAAYRHFSGHGDLIHTVKEYAGQQLAASMKTELAKSEPRADAAEEALRRIEALGRGYLHFALAEPGLFRTAFCRSDRDFTGHSAEEQAAGMAASPAFQMLGETLDALLAAGLLAPEQRPFAEVFAWSAVHGLAMLILDGPLSQCSDEERDQCIERVLDGVAYGLVTNRP
jgi:AcrR family transcriptional regulator